MDKYLVEMHFLEMNSLKKSYMFNFTKVCLKTVESYYEIIWNANSLTLDIKMTMATLVYAKYHIYTGLTIIIQKFYIKNKLAS